MAKLKIEKMKIADIKEYTNNPRNNKKAIQPVIKSIEKFGYVNPIIVDEDNIILAGHTRIKALQDIGFLEVEIIRLTGLTEEQKKSYRIADNRTQDFAKWDGNLLEAEMREITADDWTDFGFREKDLGKLKPNECTCPKCGRTFLKV